MNVQMVLLLALQNIELSMAIAQLNLLILLFFDPDPLKQRKSNQLCFQSFQKLASST